MATSYSPLPLLLLLLLLHLPSTTPSTPPSSTSRALRTLLLDDSNISLLSSPPPTVLNARNLIALPIPNSFDPPMGHFSKGKLQDGDKVCLPSSYWSSIQANDVEVPWAVNIRRLENEEDVYRSGGQELRTSDRIKVPNIRKGPRDMVGGREEVLASPLDFRAPSQYIFIPNWVIRSLGIRPGDVVRVELLRELKMGGLVKMRPLTFSHKGKGDDDTPIGTGGDFLKISNHQAVLETELKHYSTITPGTTISFVYNGCRYYFEVVETWTAGRKWNGGVRAMDADIRVEFTRVKTVS